MKGLGRGQSPSFSWLRSWGSEKVTIIIPQVPADLVVERFRLIFTIETELGGFTTDTVSLLLLLLLPDNSPLLLHSFVPLRSLITETCSRTSTVARLRSQNGFGPKWLLFCQDSRGAWFPSSRMPPTLSAYMATGPHLKLSGGPI